MHEVKISPLLKGKVENLKLACIECDVTIEEFNKILWQNIVAKIEALNKELKVEEISKMDSIAASRRAYKNCGKDPARYRLSAEALLRRVLKRKELYQVNNVVDLLNLVSISTGFSIGGYDADKIEGAVEFGIGQKDEAYEGIGRGALNIEFMPTFRDKKGAFGTPTSDSVRTCVTNKTTRFLMIIIDFGASSLPLAAEMAEDLLNEYASAQLMKIKNIK